MRDEPTVDSWVRRYHPAPAAEVRLACLPHAGGSASFYFPMSKALGPAVEVLAVQYPGRQDRRKEACIEDIAELADLVAERLRPWAADRPLAIFGHSMGATLGFEIAQRFQHAGAPPPMLFVSGRRAPSRHRAETVHLRDDDGLLAEIRALSGTDRQLLDDDELLRAMLPAIRADYRAIERYRYQPRPPLSVPIHALVGTSDPRVDIEDARAWREHTTGEFDLHTFPGGHFYLNGAAAQVIDLVAAELSTLSRTARPC
ncbi:thioesterase II family protein [Nocardia arthritidis]|uniref:Thioesterase TesA n=1 Tax=Nocardia arthritidis TaxID=228602 RepID=A0A6G9YM20_9NOCA|nr:alpha/beta fold hydrolase [Nocardia arthritidis]QIS14231.1 alpha/beta fold hydrolase [Nocardia arthritidis]